MKTVAYLRVSTAQQDVGSQPLAFLEYARKHDFRIDDFIDPTVGLLLIFESYNTADEMFRNTRFINKLFGVAAREGAWSTRPAALC